MSSLFLSASVSVVCIRINVFVLDGGNIAIMLQRVNEDKPKMTNFCRRL